MAAPITTNYVVRLKRDARRDHISRYANDIKEWDDAEDADIKKHGDSSTRDLIRYNEFIQNVETFIKDCPLEYRDEDFEDIPANYRDLSELYASEENYMNERFMVEGLLNYGSDYMLDTKIDAIYFDRSTDMYLYNRVLNRLRGNKNSIFKNPGNDKVKHYNLLTAGIARMREAYLGDHEAIKDRHKDKLRSMNWLEDVTLASHKESFIAQLNRCRVVGVMKNFDSVKDAWDRSIKLADTDSAGSRVLILR